MHVGRRIAHPRSMMLRFAETQAPPLNRCESAHRVEYSVKFSVVVSRDVIDNNVAKWRCPEENHPSLASPRMRRLMVYPCHSYLDGHVSEENSSIRCRHRDPLPQSSAVHSKADFVVAGPVARQADRPPGVTRPCRLWAGHSLQVASRSSTASAGFLAQSSHHSHSNTVTSS
jgi:hypothetical protein